MYGSPPIGDGLFPVSFQALFHDRKIVPHQFHIGLPAFLPAFGIEEEDLPSRFPCYGFSDFRAELRFSKDNTRIEPVENFYDLFYLLWGGFFPRTFFDNRRHLQPVAP